MRRAEQRGDTATRAYMRRLLVLLAIGAAHIALLWYGDILLAYATLGFPLLLFRRARPDAKLIVLALVLALGTRATFAVWHHLSEAPAAVTPASQIEKAQERKEQRLVGFSRGYRDVVRQNVSLYWNDLIVEGLGIVLMLQIFARFLLGLYAGRRDVLQRIEDYRPVLRRALPWLIAAAVIGNGIGLVHRGLEHERHVDLSASWWGIGSMPLAEAGVLALSACYACALTLMFYGSVAWRRRVSKLAPVGRMALSNYLTHSVIYLFLFTGAGLGLLGRVGPAFCLVLSVAVFGAQVALSGWWLRRYRFGPAEWLWRTATYGRLQPMRVQRGSIGVGY